MTDAAQCSHIVRCVRLESRVAAAFALGSWQRLAPWFAALGACVKGDLV